MVDKLAEKMYTIKKEYTMQKKIRSFIAFILIILSLGCSVIFEERIDAEQFATPTPDPTSIPTLEPTPEPTAEEIYVSAPDTDTPTPTDTPELTAAPTPTVVPTPTATAEPNPYVGVWTIEDLPFSLELRDDKTYLITVSEQEREGTYTFDANSVTLSVSDERAVELQYYTKADVFKIDSFILIRDDLVFFFDIGGVPVSFQNENEDLTVRTRGAVVDAVAKGEKQIGSYCFTAAGLMPPENSRDWFDVTGDGTSSESIRVFKYDGSYTLWTRDADGTLLTQIDVTVESGFQYPIFSDGIDYLHQSLRLFLRERGTGVDELNRGISRDVTAAGIYTRAGAVTAGVSLISALSKYGYSVGYQENGEYQAAQEWGVNPKWGAKLALSDDDSEDDTVESVESYTGMNGTACIVWAYKQAGLNLCATGKTTIAALGERERARDNRTDADRAKSGDIIKHGGHYAMVIDRLDQDEDGADDAYLVFEMVSPLLTMQILPFNKMQGADVFSMDAFFDGTGKNQSKVRYWKDTFRIPAEDFPMYLKETIDSETTQQSFMTLIEKLGF